MVQFGLWYEFYMCCGLTYSTSIAKCPTVRANDSHQSFVFLIILSLCASIISVIFLHNDRLTSTNVVWRYLSAQKICDDNGYVCERHVLANDTQNILPTGANVPARILALPFHVSSVHPPPPHHHSPLPYPATTTSQAQDPKTQTLGRLQQVLPSTGCLRQL